MGLMMVKVEAREYHLEMLISELKSLNEKIRSNTINTVSTMANALAARDIYTKGHTERVANLSEQIAKEMGLEDSDVEFIRLGGLLHDIGKIGFPDHLFQPHEAKNPPEMVNRIIKHPTVGAEILKELDFLGPALEYVQSHHERPDGKGYPSRLKDANIPLGAKVIAVADSFDAMTTERPYQKAMTPNAALEILQRHAGTKWDAECVKALGRYLASVGE
jgi:putative nucleotidyltransferase with HDIG domain